MNFIKKLLAGSALLTISIAGAQATPQPAGTGNCGDGSVTVTNYWKPAIAGSNFTPSPAINYSKCVGVFPGNDVPGVAPGNALPTTNLGWYNDGYMNGEANKQGDYFTGYEFTGGAYPAKDGNPGWIYLGTLNFGGAGTGTFDPVDSIGGVPNSLFGAEIFSASYNATTGKGTWSFTPDKNIATKAKPLFGNNYFDQFALVFKQAGNEKGGFAAYDFVSDQFGVTPPPSVEDPILNFSGEWDLTKVFGSKDMSHIALWARDPGPDNQVPEPSTVALLGLALVGLSVVARRRRAL